MAQIRVTSLKALNRLLAFLAEDPDLAEVMAPLEPGVRPEKSHWWYTLVATGPLTFVAQINVPPGDLRALLSRAEKAK